MKARDIIPGWPRGKSTTQPSLEAPLFQLIFIRRPEEEDMFAIAQDHGEDRYYHAGQQAMVDRYRFNEGQRSWLLHRIWGEPRS